MKIIVCTRPVEHNLSVRPDRSAVEAALRLKELAGGSVTVFCLGGISAMNQIREAVAMGCDSGRLISVPDLACLDAYACGALLAAALKEETFDAVITGCYAADADAIQTGLLIAGHLGLPQVSYAEDIRPFDGNETNKFLLVRRQFEDRSHVLKVKMPCLISALPLPNKPIYMTAEGITKAYAEDIPSIEADSLAKELGAGTAAELSVIHLRDSYRKKPRERGTLLTVPTAEAVSAIMETLNRSHLL